MQPHDRRVAPHAEVEVAGDERLDHRRGGRVVAVVDRQVVAGVAPRNFSNVLFAIMYAVTGELPAAHGCLSDRDRHRLARLRAHDRGADSAIDAAPAVVMKRRRETPRIG